jgi:hypothetical protein
MRALRGLKLILTGVVTLLVLLGLSPAGASSANISHSYLSSSPISNGSIVALDPKRTDYVVTADTSNGDRLLGVAVASDDSLLAVDAGKGKVQVATSGNANTVVSTVNGDIKVGDQIAVSPFTGVGMKASGGTHVIGVAQTAFNNGSENATTQEITDKNGKTKEVALGYVRISIAIGKGAGVEGDQNLNDLQKLAKSLTGREVSTVRVIISLIIALVALTALVVLIYASIYGSIISIGRNPLAKYAVFRTLGSVVGMSVLMAGVAALTIFFLLR